jgi:hypothetical protein
VDELVHICLDQHAYDALEVGLVAWSRVAHHRPEATVRAQQLFDSVVLPAGPVNARERRLHYIALLWTWSRSNLPCAPNECLALLNQMKTEGTQRGLVLVEGRSYGAVGTAFANVGDTGTAERLWNDMDEHNVTKNQYAYKWMIRAHQVKFERDGDDVSRQRGVQLYEELFEAYSHSSHDIEMQPHVSTLQLVISMLASDPDQVIQVLKRSMRFEDEYPECTGLVNERLLMNVLQSFTRVDLVEQAESLLYSAIGSKRLQPSQKMYGIVMDGYARRNTKASLKQLASILDSIETHILQNNIQGPGDETRYLYNIAMKSCVATNRDNAVRSVKSILARMHYLAREEDDFSFLPDIVSYNTYMTALVRQSQPGNELLVQAVLEKIKADPVLQQHDLTFSCNIAMNAWAQSGASDASERIKAILLAMETPDTRSYGSLLAVYAKAGLANEATALLGTMHQKSRKRTCQCRPNKFTYSTVLGAIENSSYSDKWTRAKLIFKQLLQHYDGGDKQCTPDAKIVTAMLTILNTSAETPLDKYREIENFLRALDERGYRHDSSTLQLLSNVCISTRDEADSDKAFALLYKVFEAVQSSANWRDYDCLLKATKLLVKDLGVRKSIMDDLFKRCARSGHVSPQILETVSADSSSRSIPAEWTRNVLGQSQH